jgi:hypothetical protein
MVRGTDDGTDGRWLTYDELATVRGIKRIGAVRLAQRQKWRRQPGNDGKTRIMVPTDALALVRGTPTPDAKHEGAANGARDDAGTAVVAFTAALAALEKAHAGEVAGLRERAVRAEGERDQARGEAREAKDAAESLRRADDARRARGRWARLRAAWWGR